MEKIDHLKRDHALLSASGASRWLNCPPSAKLEDGLPDTTSKYAAEGTLAHEFCDIRVRKDFNEINKRQYTYALKKLQQLELYSREMENYAEDYSSYITEKVKSKDAVIIVEEQLDFSRYVPEGFGTGDCIIIQDNILTVVDYKYGQGVPVSAEDNAQMRLYALGAIEMYSQIYDFEKVEMCIYQPRINNISECVETVDSLIRWGESVVKPTADLAFRGEGEFKAGNHCTFCKIKAKCRYLSDYCMATVAEEFEDESGQLNTSFLAPKDIALIIERTKLIKNWLSDVESYAIDGMLNGELDVPGYKVVEGRSNRNYIDQDKIVDVLKSHGYEESILFEKKLLTITAMEKAIGKKDFIELIGDYVEKPKGAPALAPMKDKRPVYTNTDDFENIEE